MCVCLHQINPRRNAETLKYRQPSIVWRVIAHPFLTFVGYGPCWRHVRLTSAVTQRADGRSWGRYLFMTKPVKWSEWRGWDDQSVVVTCDVLGMRSQPRGVVARVWDCARWPRPGLVSVGGSRSRSTRCRDDPPIDWRSVRPLPVVVWSPRTRPSARTYISPSGTDDRSRHRVSECLDEPSIN